MSNAAVASLVDALREYALLESAQLNAVVRILEPRTGNPKDLADELVRRGWLSPYQAGLLLQGRAGDLTVGSYVLLEPIGEGGMGQVFKARHRKMGRTDAVKVIRADRLGNTDALKRFQREMTAAASLSHPNVVHAFFADEDRGRHYIAMELLSGADLAQQVEEQGPLPFAAACEYTRQAALGLQHAHERGLVHRDVKPHNLLLTAGNVIKVLDLGIARLAPQPGGDEATLTAAGTLIGSPDYMAPEQARQSHDVDGRADLYSLGCTLYFLLTGRTPFSDRPMAAKIAAHLFEQPEPVAKLRPDTPADLAAVVRRLMAKKPQERFQSAGELAAVLATIGKGLSFNANAGTDVWQEDDIGPLPTPDAPTEAAAPMPASVSRQQPPRRRGGWAGQLGASGALVAVIAGLLWAFLLGPLKPNFESLPAPPSTEPQPPKPTGTLLLQTDEPMLRMLVRPKDKPDEAHEAKPGEPLTLDAGDYDLELTLETAAGLRLSANEASVRPDQQATVRVEGVPTSPWGLVSRPAAFVGVQSWTVTTRGGRGGVNHLAYSPDGKFLAAVHEDNVVRLLDPAGDVVHAFVVHGARVRALAWSPDKTEPTLAVADDGASVRIWSAATGRLVRGLEFAADALAWSPDGKTLACAMSSEVQLWDVANGLQTRSSLAQGSPIHCLAWAPDGAVLAAAGADGAVHLWRPPEWKEEVRQGHTGVVFALAWSPDSSTLASAGRDLNIRRWPMKAGAAAPPPIAVGRKTLTALAWVTDKSGLKIASSGNPGAGEAPIQLWNPVSGDLVRTIGPAANDMIAIDQSPDGKTLAFGGYSRNIYLWDTKNDRERTVVEGNNGDLSASASWSPDGKLIATNGWSSTIEAWKADSGELWRRAPVTNADRTGGAAWASAGKRLAYPCADQVYIWSPLESRHYPLMKAEGTPRLTAFAPDGVLLAVACDDRHVHIWDVTANAVKYSLDVGRAPIEALAWTPDGKFLAAGDDRGETFVWEITTGLRVRQWHQQGRIRSLAWSTDGKTLAESSGDGLLGLWDREAAKLLGNLGGPRSLAGPMTWMPDGRSLLLAGEHHHFRLWDVETKELLKNVRRGGGGAAKGGEFSPDASLFAIPSRSWTLRLWETATGRPLGTLVRMDSGWLVLSDDGHFRAENKIVEKEVVYVVQTEEGQRMLSPEAFAKTYKWKNDPARARLDTR